MHRLACLRDDVIFLIFCYQKYKYRTDYTRVNEFGQCSEPTDEMLKSQNDSQENVSSSNATAISTTASDILLRKRRGAKDKK